MLANRISVPIGFDQWMNFDWLISDVHFFFIRNHLRMRTFACANMCEILWKRKNDLHTFCNGSKFIRWKRSRMNCREMCKWAVCVCVCCARIFFTSFDVQKRAKHNAFVKTPWREGSSVKEKIRFHFYWKILMWLLFDLVSLLKSCKASPLSSLARFII